MSWTSLKAHFIILGDQAYFQHFDTSSCSVSGAVAIEKNNCRDFKSSKDCSRNLGHTLGALFGALRCQAQNHGKFHTPLNFWFFYFCVGFMEEREGYIVYYHLPILSLSYYLRLQTAIEKWVILSWCIAS